MMHGPAWNHRYVEASGIRVHYVRHGGGAPLVLLHGWPEFWYVWRKNIPTLAESFDVVAPDLRGFGDSDKPGDPPEELLGNLVEDLRALSDSLGFERFGIVSHDVGAYVAQRFAREYPGRLSGLFSSRARNGGEDEGFRGQVRASRSPDAAVVSDQNLRVSVLGNRNVLFWSARKRTR
jgi:pimeloyl-ACP methyl ester carboxylesterase